MNLHDYFQSPGSLSVGELAGKLGIKSDAQIRQWQHGYAGRRPDAANCVAIEKVTGGVVTRQDLRPDDWRAIWPELAKRNKKAVA